MEILIFICLDTSRSFVKLFVLGYIDPGTGSIILQAIVATIVGAGIAFKLYWNRIKKYLGVKKTIKANDPGNPESDIKPE